MPYKSRDKWNVFSSRKNIPLPYISSLKRGGFRQFILKKELETLKKELESSKNETKEMNDKFYTRIGEIFTLLIAGISIIVFNIKVGKTEIDFSNPKEASFQILSYNIPFLLILFFMFLIFESIIRPKRFWWNVGIKVFIIVGWFIFLA